MPNKSSIISPNRLQKSLFPTALIFAGGKSSRMGQDKSLLPFGGYETLCEYQFQRLKNIFSEVFISTKNAKYEFDAPLVCDTYPQSSPLVGLISFFESTDYDSCFILSVDAPFVDRKIIERLFEAASDMTLDAIIAKSPEGMQPLCGIYRRSIISQAKRNFLEENHRLGALLKMSKIQLVVFDIEEPFANLNTPEQYQSALEKIKMR